MYNDLTMKNQNLVTYLTVCRDLRPEGNEETEIEIQICGTYLPGDPGVHTYANGDPGYPSTPDSIEIHDCFTLNPETREWNVPFCESQLDPDELEEARQMLWGEVGSDEDYYEPDYDDRDDY